MGSGSWTAGEQASRLARAPNAGFFYPDPNGRVLRATGGSTRFRTPRAFPDASCGSRSQVKRGTDVAGPAAGVAGWSAGYRRAMVLAGQGRRPSSPWPKRNPKHRRKVPMSLAELFPGLVGRSRRARPALAVSQGGEQPRGRARSSNKEGAGPRLGGVVKNAAGGAF